MVHVRFVDDQVYWHTRKIFYKQVTHKIQNYNWKNLKERCNASDLYSKGIRSNFGRDTDYLSRLRFSWLSVMPVDKSRDITGTSNWATTALFPIISHYSLMIIPFMTHSQHLIASSNEPQIQQTGNIKIKCSVRSHIITNKTNVEDVSRFKYLCCHLLHSCHNNLMC